MNDNDDDNDDDDNDDDDDYHHNLCSVSNGFNSYMKLLEVYQEIWDCIVEDTKIYFSISTEIQNSVFGLDWMMDDKVELNK